MFEPNEKFASTPDIEAMITNHIVSIVNEARNKSKAFKLWNDDLITILEAHLIVFAKDLYTTGSFKQTLKTWLRDYPSFRKCWRKFILSRKQKNSRFLSDISPKDKPWDVHRASTDKTSALYADAGYERYAERLQHCSTFLSFEKVVNEQRLKLRDAHFCKHRHCATCQWRRTLKWTSRFLGVMPLIQKDYSAHRYIFLTLTVRNCDVADLRETIDLMNHAWKKLIGRKAFPADGYVKSMEVTRVYDCYDGSKLVGRHGKTWVEKWEKDNKRKLRLVETMDAHPHFHCLLIVPSGYFSKAGGYLSQVKWVELWQKCLKVSYTPIVDVRAVKSDSQKNLVDALKETLKYCIKEEDLIESKDWLIEITHQLHKTKAVTLGGIFKKYISELEPEDYINDDDETSAEVTTGQKYYFDWLGNLKRYVSKKSIDLGE